VFALADRHAGLASRHGFPLFAMAGVFICELIDHGVRFALVTAMLRAMVESLSDEVCGPGGLLTRMNRDLKVILRESDS
jgi:phosphoserine phosphatase RsbU/P